MMAGRSEKVRKKYAAIGYYHGSRFISRVIQNDFFYNDCKSTSVPMPEVMRRGTLNRSRRHSILQTYIKKQVFCDAVNNHSE